MSSEHQPTLFGTINRWVFPLAGLLAIGPLAAWPIAALRAPDGAWDTTPLMSASPVVGLLAGVGAIVLAGLWGVITAVVTSARYGLFTTGLALAWASWSTGTMDLIMRTEDAAAHYWRLPLEAGLFGALAVLVAGAIAGAGRQGGRGAKGGASVEGAVPQMGGGIVSGVLRAMSSAVAVWRRDSRADGSVAQHGLVVLAAAAVGALVAWLLAVESLKGQTFAAAAIGALLGATAGEIVASSGKGELQRAPVALFFIAAAVLAVAAPVAAMGIHSGGSGVAAAATTARLLPVFQPLPLDWIAGAFVGVPVGLTWADALVDRAQKA